MQILIEEERESKVWKIRMEVLDEVAKWSEMVCSNSYQQCLIRRGCDESRGTIPDSESENDEEDSLVNDGCMLNHIRQFWNGGVGSQLPRLWDGESWGLHEILSYDAQEYEMRTLSKVVTLQK